MRPVLILFAKAPEPGRVKTRLAKTIGTDNAAKLHRAFVEDTLQKATDLARQGLVDIELHTDVETDAWVSNQVTHRLQAPGDLGHRMYYALHQAFVEGRTKAMIVGTDSPTLPPSYLLNLLELPEDAAFGPCSDGGYYAICCRRITAEVFRSVNWSAASTLEETMAAWHRAGLSTAVGESWFDVDEIEDLDRLREDRNLPPWTRAALEEIYGIDGRNESARD